MLVMPGLPALAAPRVRLALASQARLGRLALRDRQDRVEPAALALQDRMAQLARLDPEVLVTLVHLGREVKPACGALLANRAQQVSVSAALQVLPVRHLLGQLVYAALLV